MVELMKEEFGMLWKHILEGFDIEWGIREGLPEKQDNCGNDSNSNKNDDADIYWALIPGTIVIVLLVLTLLIFMSTLNLQIKKWSKEWLSKLLKVLQEVGSLRSG